MSWIDNINDVEFQIRTGDGATYAPKWLPSGKSIEPNYAAYEYPDLQGTFINRKLNKGDRYTLTFVFDGGTAIDVSEAFQQSARDPRPWTIQHPYHGTLTVQPINIAIDNTKYNASQYTCTVVDTILSTLNTAEPDLRGELLEIKANLDVSVADDFVSIIPVPAASDVATMQDSLSTWDAIQSTALRYQNDLSAFKSELNDAQNDASKLIADASQAMRSYTNLINYPFKVRDSVQTRFTTYTEMYAQLQGSIANFPTRSDKGFFASAGASLISSACNISILEPDAERTDEDTDAQILYSIEQDYTSRQNVIDQVNNLIDLYNQFVTDTDSLLTERADQSDSFQISGEVLRQLQLIVVLTARNLQGKIFGAKQERTFFPEADTNIFILAHRLLGAATDENVQTLIDLNGIGLNELQGIDKGREIVYYV